MILMDASRAPEIIPSFIRIDRHLIQLAFSAPAVLECDESKGLLLLEDFGDTTFAGLLDKGEQPELLFTLATDVLIELHKRPQAVPAGLRSYRPERMLEDMEFYLEWCTPDISETGKTEFRNVWRKVLPLAHQVPVSLLLRDYHVANLMLLPGRTGVQQVGLLDFQDAYKGPVTYDLVSLLEDARHDVAEDLQEQMIEHYLAQFPSLDRSNFKTSMAILAALRHTRVLGVFERLSRRDRKSEYRQLHSPRVKRLLQKALGHPVLAAVKGWFEEYATEQK